MTAQLIFDFPRIGHYSLDRFVGGLAEKALALRGESLWISGAAESGKSHLLQGLCQAVESEQARAVYIALEPALDPQILKDLAVFDLIALDGVDAVIGHPDWELALFDLNNSVCDLGGSWLVLASRAPLPDIGFLLADFASRARAMHWMQTGQLTDEEKVEVLKRVAQESGFQLPDEVLGFLLGRAPREIGTLISLLNRLAEESLRAQRRLTVPFLKQVLEL
ncbi:MAG: HdaA/DnaA family protein [Pseudomonadales bacterium]